MKTALTSDRGFSIEQELGLFGLWGHQPWRWAKSYTTRVQHKFVCTQVSPHTPDPGYGKKLSLDLPNEVQPCRTPCSRQIKTLLL